MLLQRISFGAIRFFLLQAAAISFENFAAFLFQLKTSKTSRPHMSLRLLGYSWVLVWFIWTLPFILDPNIESGMFQVKSESLLNVIEYLQRRKLW